MDSTLQVAVTKKYSFAHQELFYQLSIIQDRREGLTHMYVLLIAQ
jgi:hypothetical protein